MRFAGIAVKAGTIHMAVVERDAGQDGVGIAVELAFSRLSPRPGSLTAPVLRELKEQVQQEIRDWDIQSITLVDTTKYVQWKYADAYARVLSISAVMYGAAEADLPYVEVKPSVIGKYLLAPKLETLDPALLGFSKAPKYWTTGGFEAYAAAAFGARPAA